MAKLVSNLSQETPSYVQNMVFTPSERSAAGVRSAYADTYNEAVAADVQTALAEYFYNKYQSPAALARQYEEAGLNRNFASTNVSSPSVPKANPRSSISESTSREFQNTLSTINGVVSLIGEGVKLVSEVAGVPQDIAYKKYRNILLAHQSEKTGYEGDSAYWKSLFDKLYYSGDFQPYIMNGVTLDPANSPAFQQQDLRNQLMNLKVQSADWDLNNLKPEQLKQAQEIIKGLLIKNQLLGKQNENYDANALMSIVPSILTILKLFL